MYKQKKGYVILKNNSNTYKFECNTYNQILDDYFTLTGKVNLSNLPRGEYEVYYVLAENFTTSAIRGIRFANYNMYNEELNANKITTISI